MGEFLSNCRGRWDSLSLGKLLKECRVIGVNGKVVLGMFPGMVLPGRSTIPVHFGVIIETTVQTGYCNI